MFKKIVKVVRVAHQLISIKKKKIKFKKIIR